MTRIVDLVDSLEYARSNCFAHQLHSCLHATPGVMTLALDELPTQRGFDGVVCRLRQRTLHRVVDRLASALGDTPLVIYDQDPWEAFRTGSPYRGTYERACELLNVKAIAVTTVAWADLIARRGMPGTFVRMGIMPRYCSSAPAHVDRCIDVGFVGSVHPHRARLFSQLEGMGIHPHIIAGNGLSYPNYLNVLSTMRIFVHSEDHPVDVGNERMNLSDGLWVKDVEAAARGCFTVRNEGRGSEPYYAGLETVRCYTTPADVPAIIEGIQRIDPEQRQGCIDRTVSNIRASDAWRETATRLVELTGAHGRCP